MTEPTLFEGYEALPDPFEGLSADRKRTLRQHQMVEAGIHPLTRQRAVPEAGTCGDCRFRQVLSHHGGSFPKCTRDEARLTHSAATDCRAWWPACTDFELGDNKVSPDAMRVRPTHEKPGSRP